MRLERHVLSGICVLLAVSAACHDAPTRPRLQSPLVGKWELTTHFDTFTFETPAPSPPDCPNSGGMYCTHYRTTTDGAYLGGMIEVTDTSSSGDTLITRVVATGVLQVSYCDSFDLSGCVHWSARTPIPYTGAIDGTPVRGGGLYFYMGEPQDPNSASDNYRLLRPNGSNFNLTYAGDSIYGPAYWGKAAGRSPPSFRGTMVLHRVH